MNWPWEVWVYECDKGAGEQELRKLRDGIQAKRDARIRANALREAANWLANNEGLYDADIDSALRALADSIEEEA